MPNNETQSKVDGSVLLKIYRDFSTNEAVAILKRHISALEYEIGVLKSENAEFTDETKKIKQMLPEEQSEYRRTIAQNKLLVKCQRRNNELSEKLKRARKNETDWQIKYFDIYRANQKN